MVWHTVNSSPLLTPEIEPFAWDEIRKKIVKTSGAFVHEIGGTETHVHVAVTTTPTIGIAEFIGQLNGASSHEVNRRTGRHKKVLEWQAGYGVVSFGTRDLEWVKAYVRDQKRHHAEGTTHERLERTSDPEA
jgi:putative transposase